MSVDGKKLSELPLTVSVPSDGTIILSSATGGSRRMNWDTFLTLVVNACGGNVPTALSQLTDDSTHRLVTDTEKATWNGKSDFSGDYDDLTNKPSIPSDLSDLDDDSTHRLVTDTEKTTWNNKSNFSGSYNDLTNKPSIPAPIQYSTMPAYSSLPTGTIVQYIGNTTETYINGYFYINTGLEWEEKQVQEGGGGTVPTALSDLTDDTNHRLVTDTEKATWNNKSNFSGSYDDLTDKPTIPAAQVKADWESSSGMSEILNKPTIPTTINSLTNVSIVGATNGDLLTYDSSLTGWTNKSKSTLDIQNKTLANSITLQGTTYTALESAVDAMADILDDLGLAEDTSF